MKRGKRKTSPGRPVPMRVTVYHDRTGQVASIVEVKTDPKAPPAGIQPIPDCESFELDLTGELAKVSLIDLHTGYRVDRTAKPPLLLRKEGYTPRGPTDRPRPAPAKARARRPTGR
jgi:hypothetical protein